MNRRWARVFLAAATAVCLFGAWRTPYHFPLPQEKECWLEVTRFDDAGRHTYSLGHTPQRAELLGLLQDTSLRLCLPPGAYGGLTSPEDFYFLIDAAFPQDGLHVSLFVGQRNGRQYGEGQLLGVSYDLACRIPDPKPLLDFLENATRL